MRRIRTLALFGSVIAPMSADASAQQTNEQLAALRAQLGAIYDKCGTWRGTWRGEGSGGPYMERMGAGIDCSKGRYNKGIKALEDLLRRDRSPSRRRDVPPLPTAAANLLPL